MARRITITVKLEEQGENKYSWDDVAETILQSSVELFVPAAAARAAIEAIAALMGPAPEPEAATSASVPAPDTSDLPF